MKRLFVALGITGALVFGLLLALGSVARAIASPDPLEFERQQQAIERARAIAPIETFAAAVWALLPLLVTVGLIVFLAAWGSVALIRFRFERQPNSAGLLPVNAWQLEDAGPAALAAYHQARIEESRRPLVPHSLSYHNAPRLDYRGNAGGNALPAPDEPIALAAVPTFAQLLDGGRVGRGNPMLLGYDAEGQPISGDWNDLYSCAVGGLSGSGKSWTATFLAAQAGLYGARYVVLDPHSGNPESLSTRLAPMRPRFVCDVASEPAEMLAAVDLVTAEFERRKARRQRGEPWLFIVDEFSALQRGDLADPLAELVECLGQEGRKLGLYAMVCGQVWSASRAGGTELRDSLASAYIHRLRPAQARMLSGLTAQELPADLLSLPAGSAYLLDTSGELRRVIIPQMSPSDVGRVAQMLDSGAAPAAPSGVRPIGFRPAPAGAASGEASGEASDYPHRAQQNTPNLSPEEARIVAAFLSGKSLSELAAELNGGKRSGDGFNQAARRVSEIIRKALGNTEAA